MSISRDYLNRSRKELTEFIKGDTTFRIEHYLTHFSHAICSIQKVFHRHPELEYSKIDLLSLDALHADIRIIPYYDSKKRVSYCRFDDAKKLTLPACNYVIIDHSYGLYRDQATNVIKYSQLIAIDFMLMFVAKRWLSEIPNISKLLR